MTPEIGMYVLGMLVGLLGFFSAWAFREILSQGKVLSAQDKDISGLRERIAASEAVAKERKEELDRRFKERDDQIQRYLSDLSNNMEKSMSRVEGEVVALHKRLDRVLEQGVHHG